MSAFTRRLAQAFSSGVTYNPGTGKIALNPVGSQTANLQSVPWAASITPDPSLGEVIVVGTIGGAFTIQNPSVNVPGSILEFHFQQPATGMAAPSWGAYYQADASTHVSLVANSRSTVRFRCLTSTFWALESAGAPTGSGGGSNPPPNPTPTTLTDLQSLLTNDMTLPHQGPLDGVPSYYDWAPGPRIGMGNDTQGMTAATAWGEVYSSNNPSTNTLVEVRNLSMAYLNKQTGVWTVLQQCVTAGPTGMDAGYFQADFQGNVTSPNQPVTLGGGTRAAAPNAAFNFHFFPQGRVSITPSAIGAIVAWFEARLILADGGGVDDRASARFLAGAGGDYWQNLTNPWNGAGSNGDFAIGRHRWVTNEWQTFTAHTMTAQQIADNPPPITLASNGGTSAGGGGNGSGSGTTTGWLKPTGRNIRVMPLGDSITGYMGEDSTGWITMPARFTTIGYPIQTVGSQTAPNGTIHEGHGAWCADDTGDRCTHTNGYNAGGILQNITSWLGTYTPDVVVLNIGTNDRAVNSPYTDAQTVAAIGSILDTIKSVRPSVATLVSKLRYEGELGGYTVNGTFNSLLEQLLTQKRAAGHLAWVIDMYQYFSVSGDYRDYVHQSEQGTGKMMNAIFDALKSLFDGAGPRTDPPPTDPGSGGSGGTGGGSSGDTDINTGAGYAKAFTHDFPGSSLDTGNWAPFGTQTVTGNTVRLPLTAYNGINTVPTFNMTDSSISVKVDMAAAGGTSPACYMQVRAAAGDARRFSVEISTAANSWKAQFDGSAISLQVIGSGAYNAATMRYWRFKHTTSTNKLGLLVSADGSTWTTLCEATPPSGWANTGADLQLGSKDNGTGYVAFSKVNLV